MNTNTNIDTAGIDLNEDDEERLIAIAIELSLDKTNNSKGNQLASTATPTPIPETANKTRSPCLRLLITNLKERDVLRYPLPLIRGKILTCSSANVSTIFVSNLSTSNKERCWKREIGWAVVDNEFKVFVHVAVGDNVIQFRIGDETQTFVLQYIPQTNPRILRFVYIVASDHDGSFQHPDPLPKLHPPSSKLNPDGQGKLNPDGQGTLNPDDQGKLNPDDQGKLNQEHSQPKPASESSNARWSEPQNNISSGLERIKLAALMVQSLTAEKIFEHGLGRFTFNLELDDVDLPQVKSHRLSSLTFSQSHTKSGQELWNIIHEELQAQTLHSNQKEVIYVAIMSMTRFNPDTKQPVAHTALGGFPLALFGSGGLHTWARDLSEVGDCFRNTSKVDRSKYFDDSCGRGTYWANYSTTLGAVIHEIGHCFTLQHVLRLPDSPFPHPIMHRGFDHLNRAVMLTEPSTDSLEPQRLFELRNEMCWHPSSAVRLRHHRFFRLDDDPPTQPQRDPNEPNLTISLKKGFIKVKSAFGIVDIAFYTPDGDIVDHVAFVKPPFTTLPPRSYSVRLETLKNHKVFQEMKLVGITVMDILGNVETSKKLINLDCETGDESSLDHEIDVRIQHCLTGKFLSSLPTYYTHPHSSRQQKVICVDKEAIDESHFVWTLRSCQKIPKTGQMIHLLHKKSKNFLHSHAGHPSPLSDQQEVTSYPIEDDNNNYWKIEELDDSVLGKVRLEHILTKQYLHSHDIGWFEDFHGSPSPFYVQEVTCYGFRNDNNNDWQIIPIRFSSEVTNSSQIVS